MKKPLSILFAGLLIITTTLYTFAQTTQTRQVSGFNSISSAGSFNVHIKIDGTESLKITGDEEAINEVETTVNNGQLRIGTKSKISWKLFNNKKIDVYITAKSLSGLTGSGSGNIKLDGTLTGNVEIKASGSGNITAAANVTALQISVSGSGNVTSTLTASQVNASVSGSGSISLTGTAKNADMKVSGSGNIRANDLKADAVDASISGSGRINVIANKSINARVSGSGRLFYTGTPATVNATTSGSGRVVKG